MSRLSDAQIAVMSLEAQARWDDALRLPEEAARRRKKAAEYRAELATGRISRRMSFGCW